MTNKATEAFGLADMNDVIANGGWSNSPKDLFEAQRVHDMRTFAKLIDAYLFNEVVDLEFRLIDIMRELDIEVGG